MFILLFEMRSIWQTQAILDIVNFALIVVCYPVGLQFEILFTMVWSIRVFLLKHNNFGDGKEQMWMVREYTDFHSAWNIHIKQYSHVLY